VFCGGVVLSYSGLEFLHLQSNIFFVAFYIVIP
jgi:hypothetical protein